MGARSLRRRRGAGSIPDDAFHQRRHRRWRHAATVDMTEGVGERVVVLHQRVEATRRTLLVAVVAGAERCKHTVIILRIACCAQLLPTSQAIDAALGRPAERQVVAYTSDNVA